jgi:hypothetical protein
MRVRVHERRRQADEVKINYLVVAEFDSPVHFDAQHWAGGTTYPYDITCRLDSFEHASWTEVRPISR